MSKNNFQVIKTKIRIKWKLELNKKMQNFNLDFSTGYLTSTMFNVRNINAMKKNPKTQTFAQLTVRTYLKKISFPN